jgi:hypothetical protein
MAERKILLIFSEKGCPPIWRGPWRPYPWRPVKEPKSQKRKTIDRCTAPQAAARITYLKKFKKGGRGSPVGTHLVGQVGTDLVARVGTLPV